MFQNSNCFSVKGDTLLCSCSSCKKKENYLKREKKDSTMSFTSFHVEFPCSLCGHAMHSFILHINQDHICFQKTPSWFVELFIRTHSSVGICVFPPVYWHRAAFHGLVFCISRGSFGILFFCVSSLCVFFIRELKKFWIDGSPSLILPHLCPKSSSLPGPCAPLCPWQVSVACGLLSSDLILVWICLLESLDLLGSLPNFS